MIKLKPTYDISLLSDEIKAQIRIIVINKLVLDAMSETANDDVMDEKAHQPSRGE